VRCVFTRPAVPDSARDEWVVSAPVTTYEVYPPHDPLVEVA
jgi:hypothetical protein